MSTNLARDPVLRAASTGPRRGREWQGPDRVCDPQADGAADPLVERPAEQRAEPDGCLPIVHDPAATRCERLRALRTELQRRRDGTTRGDIVALISPCSGEGRSQLAAELAIAFAQSGRRTLLIDADLRRPRQHALFGVADEPGLVQAIEDVDPPCLRPVRGLPRLSLLTAGGTPTDPMQLLGDRRFRALLDDWRVDFEQVVIDTSPVGPQVDGLVVADAAGRVLALSRARHTPMRDLQQMLTRLAAARAQVLGAVISHF
jgi:receptor protein-tyrosine kinase